MKKKLARILLTAAIAAGTLAGCGDSDSGAVSGGDADKGLCDRRDQGNL